MPSKRKSTAAVEPQAESSTSTPLRRSSRRSIAGQTEESEAQPPPAAKRARTTKTAPAEKPVAKAAPKAAPKAATGRAGKGKGRAEPSTEKEEEEEEEEEEKEPKAGPSTAASRKQKAATAPARPTKKAKGNAPANGRGKAVATAKDDEESEEEAEADEAPVKAKPVEVPSATTSPDPSPAAVVGRETAIRVEGDDAERDYWLLKAEPESRFENGVDVKFSIDDLRACKEPEPWDGIRNYAARNNMRKMKKGDLAFFYHSNTKEPGIVGTMTIVKEHSPDLTAHDPKTAYYDPKSAADVAAGKEPRWSVVHVKFRSKFETPITLKQLKEMGGAGQPLQNMQMLNQGRLSVSRVSAAEWRHLLSVAGAS
ncbi:hypothetical protein Sste5346_007135 [Sporothrix stenoceras]|uniref:EVE domain-containing protein n=1 Tax=Sporothrix stenoceras TaxID=5173 RepID=A0ABR3YWH9_9PEZI